MGVVKNSGSWFENKWMERVLNLRIHLGFRGQSC